MLGCVACLFCGPCGLIVCCLQLDERQCWLAPNGRQGVYASRDTFWLDTWLETTPGITPAACRQEPKSYIITTLTCFSNLLKAAIGLVIQAISCPPTAWFSNPSNPVPFSSLHQLFLKVMMRRVNGRRYDLMGKPIVAWSESHEELLRVVADSLDGCWFLNDENHSEMLYNYCISQGMVENSHHSPSQEQWCEWYEFLCWKNHPCYWNIAVLTTSIWLIQWRSVLRDEQEILFASPASSRRRRLLLVMLAVCPPSERDGTVLSDQWKREPQR